MSFFQVGYIPPDDYGRMCDVCGRRRPGSKFRVVDGVWICDLNNSHGGYIPQATLDKVPYISTKGPEPIRDAKAYAPLDSFEAVEAEILNFLCLHAPVDEFNVTASAENSSGTQTVRSAAWTCLYLYDLITEASRPVRWTAQAKAALRTCADYLLTQQCGSSTVSSAVTSAIGTTATTDVEYGGFITLAETSVYSEDVGTGGLALLRAYQTFGNSKYRDGYLAALKCLRRMQCGGGLSVKYATTSLAGTGRLRTGMWTHSMALVPSLAFDHDLYPGDLIAVEFLNAVRAQEGNLTAGDATAVGDFAEATSATISTMLSEALAFWTDGIADAGSSAAIVGLSSTTPREYFDCFIAGTTTGTGTWKYAALALAHWSFNDVTGPTARDATGNAHNGVYSGSVTPGASAATFSGGLVTVPSSSSLMPSSAITIEAYITWGGANGLEQRIIEKSYGGSNGSVPLFNLKISSATSAPMFELWAGSTPVTLTAAATVTVGQPTYLAATYDGTTMRIYLNGVEVASRSQTGLIADALSGVAVEANIGIGNQVERSRPFIGSMDELAVYGLALSAEDIAANYVAYTNGTVTLSAVTAMNYALGIRGLAALGASSAANAVFDWLMESDSHPSFELPDDYSEQYPYQSLNGTEYDPTFAPATLLAVRDATPTASATNASGVYALYALGILAAFYSSRQQEPFARAKASLNQRQAKRAENSERDNDRVYLQLQGECGLSLQPSHAMPVPSSRKVARYAAMTGNIYRYAPKASLARGIT